MRREEKLMKYKIGWYSEREKKWKYITVGSMDKMLAEVADKACLSDKVSIRAIPHKLKKD